MSDGSMYRRFTQTCFNQPHRESSYVYWAHENSDLFALFVLESCMSFSVPNCPILLWTLIIMINLILQFEIYWLRTISGRKHISGANRRKDGKTRNRKTKIKTTVTSLIVGCLYRLLARNISSFLSVSLFSFCYFGLKKSSLSFCRLFIPK